SLIQQGLEVNANDNHGNTPLHCSAKVGNLKACKLLIENGADINRKNNNAGTALHRAAKGGHFPVMAFLIEKGAEPMPKTISDSSAT
ncbi:MAG: ankyrin repeat domain-containing protein, partial [Blastocatellia bacterium]